MKSLFRFLILPLAAALTLSACDSGMKRALGFKKHTPDEFMVISRPPLTVPPDFGLPPPADSDVRPQSQVREEAKKVLFTDKPAASAGKSLTRGEAGLLGAAEAGAADPNIRQVLGEEARAVESAKEDKGVIEKVIDPLRPQKKDPLVDIDKEEERLSKNKEEGKSPNEGDVPVAGSKNKGIVNEMLGF